MAAVGRARLKTESLINSQKSRALYGEAGEKDTFEGWVLFRFFFCCCECVQHFDCVPRYFSSADEPLLSLA